MKTFYPSEKVQKHYKMIGICSIIVAVIILLITPFGKINSIQKILFILILIALPTLFITRNKRIILTIDSEALYFNDGMLSKTRIPLDMIKKVEYHPDLKIRVYTFKNKKAITILNVFSLDDQKEILDYLQSKRHRIKIVYLEKPEKIINIEKYDKKGKKK